VGVPGAGLRAIDPNAVYSNVTTFAGQAFSPAGATAGITRLMMDDITSTGGMLTTIRFNITNLDVASFSARPRIRFWLADGAGGAPGTPYSTSINGGPPSVVGFSFNPITFAANSATTFTFDLVAGSSQFAIPSGTFWAGMTFDNAGPTATNANLNNLGMGIFGPPDVGSSADNFFVTTNPGSFLGTANPGGTQQNFGGLPPANFGWEFVVPAPGSLALLGLGGLLAGRRRR